MDSGCTIQRPTCRERPTNQIHFFVLHEDENDPEVKANGGNPFHNLAKGAFTENEIVVSGSRENTTIRQYRLVLKRIGNQGQP